MRAKLTAAVAVLAAAIVTPASAGPLDPPKAPPLRVFLFAPTVSNPAPFKLKLDIAASQDDGLIAVIGFQPKGKKRLLFDGDNSLYIEARRGGSYPSVAVNGQQQLPPCPADVLCSVPTFPTDVEEHVDLEHFTFTNPDVHLRYYVFVNDVPDLALTPNDGWRGHEVKGGKLIQLRDAGTEVRVNAPYRQEMVENFQGVTAPRVSGPSVAFANIPCWPAPAPGGPGRAILRNGSNTKGPFRLMLCSDYRGGASGASDLPTIWSNDGSSTGWMSFVNNLVVAVLPPA